MLGFQFCSHIIKVNEQFCYRMSPYCGSLTVWNFAAAKEGKAHEHTADVV
jgi:hypothetical protein